MADELNTVWRNGGMTVTGENENTQEHLSQFHFVHEDDILSYSSPMGLQPNLQSSAYKLPNPLSTFSNFCILTHS